MPAYHLRSVAVAIGRSPKWLDNLLSHHPIRGVTGSGRGNPRRITAEGAMQIWLVATLAQDLGVSADRAVALAEGLSREGRQEIAPGVRIVSDTVVLRQQLATALQTVAERTVLPRRGRPPKKDRGAEVPRPGHSAAERSS